MYQVFDVKESRTPPMSFPRTRESREIISPRRDWTPAFAGVTALETFYEAIKECDFLFY
jgi:hypothetical protein